MSFPGYINVSWHDRVDGTTQLQHMPFFSELSPGRCLKFKLWWLSHTLALLGEVGMCYSHLKITVLWHTNTPWESQWQRYLPLYGDPVPQPSSLLPSYPRAYICEEYREAEASRKIPPYSYRPRKGCRHHRQVPLSPSWCRSFQVLCHQSIDRVDATHKTYKNW